MMRWKRNKKASVYSFIAIALIVVITLLLVNCNSSDSKNMSPTYTTNSYITIAEFSTLTLPSFQVNSKEQVAWTACTDSGSELYLYNAGITKQITDKNKHCLFPRINENSQIVWDEFNGKASETYNVHYYTNGTTKQIESPEGSTDVYPRQNDNGDIVFERKDSDGNGQICLFSNGVIKQITKSGNNVEPQINNNGVITWYGSDNGNMNVFMYNNGLTTQLNSIPVNQFAEYDEENHCLRRINDRGNVVWVSDNDGKKEIWLYENGMTGKISEGERNVDPWLNDNGQVVWEGNDGSHSQIYLYSDDNLIKLTNSSDDSASPVINNRGQIVWQEGSQIYLYNDGEIIAITNNQAENVFPQISDGGHIAWITKEWNDNWYYRSICLASPSFNRKLSSSNPIKLKSEISGIPGRGKPITPETLKSMAKTQRNKQGQENFSFIVLGDSRGENYSWVAGEKLNKKFLEFFAGTIVPNHNPDFVIFLGDCCTNAHTVTGHENLADWKDAMQPIYQSGKPLYISKGNHELYNWCAAFRVEFQQEFTDKYFTDQPDNGPDGYKKLCYSFTWGNSYFLIFDSFYCWKAPAWHISDYHLYGDIDDTQLAWIKAQHDTDEFKNASNRFILTHAPVYGTEGEKLFSNMKALWQEIDANNYDLYFGAHEHLYSRKIIGTDIDPSYKNNIPQIVAGAAGAPLDHQFQVEVDMKEWNVNLCYHYVLVEVSGDSISTKAYRVYEDSGGNYQVDSTPFDTYSNQ